MKRIFAIFFTSLIICSFLCGCNACKKGWFADEHKFLYEKMSEILVEDDTYFLDEKWGEWGEGAIEFNQIQEEHILKGEKLSITPIGIEERHHTIFNIKYKEYDFTMNIKFMEDRSDAYVKINNIWKEKIEDYNSKSEIVQFKVFNNKFFIVTCAMRTHLSGSVRGEMPYCLYYYDFDTDEVIYCGFYAGYYDEEFGAYGGFTELGILEISVKES